MGMNAAGSATRWGIRLTGLFTTLGTSSRTAARAHSRQAHARGSFFSSGRSSHQGQNDPPGGNALPGKLGNKLFHYSSSLSN